MQGGRVQRRATVGPAFLVIVVVAAVGCKPGAEELCERYAKAQCRFQYQCCNGSERQQLGSAGFGAYHYNEETCVDELTRAYCAALIPYADSERAGRIAWDHERSGECLRELDTAASSCDAESMLAADLDACRLDEMFEGAVEDGDTCFTGVECANEEALCRPNEADEDETLISAKGTCVAPPAAGEECPDLVCARAAWCDLTEDPPICKDKKGIGEDCSADAECTSRICDGAAGQCGAKRPAGESCFADGQCESDFCDSLEARCADKRENGEPCQRDAACRSDVCDTATAECIDLGAGPDVTYDICLAGEG